LARVAVVLFGPRAFDVEKVMLSILTFTNHRDVVMLQESAEPFDLDLVISRDPKCRTFWDVPGGKRFKECSRDGVQCLGAF
jgi:hypothetical protein